ncbi:uncharacterized protein LOC113332917 [Papaver somniferum]|uniref:uncharacterized protein LOC113332917 n=1 Tax=Papaver somniferum TaxID=3469 RepID=UPI000E6F8626|nr:uncharacterized protein LOC113332917 [Papaver somniferum]
MVWVHYPVLSLEYWDEETLFKLSRALGNPVKVDDATLNYQSGHYARVLVEIDLSKKIPNKLWIITKYGCFSQSITLTNLPKFCWKCKIVGHHNFECKAKNSTEVHEDKESDSYNGKQQEVTQTPKALEKPFDICQNPEPVQVPHIDVQYPNTVVKPIEICQTPKTVQVPNVVLNSTGSIHISKGKFSPLQEDNEAEEAELSPSKILKVVEDNAIDNSEVKYINDINGTVSAEKVPTTSWSRVVQRPSSTKSPTPASNVGATKEECKVWLFTIKSQIKKEIYGYFGTVVSMSSQMITVDIGGTLISGVHAHGGLVQRRLLWYEMEAISELKFPWLIIGDFNALTSVEEKIGGKSPNRRSMTDFNEWLNHCELLQAPRTGTQFSWSNCRHESKRILCNLDRAMFNNLWLQKFPDWGYKWINARQNISVVILRVFQSKLKKLKKILQDLNWRVFGDVNVQIKNAELQVQEAMKNLDNNPSDPKALNKLVEAQNEYNSREVQLNTLLKQKSRIRWVKEGAANTNFFHTNLKIKQARNNISEIVDEHGEVISDQKKVVEVLVNNYKKKFEFKQNEDVDSLLEVIPKVISLEDQNMLDKIPYE